MSSVELEVLVWKEERIRVKGRLVRGAPASVMATKGGSQRRKARKRQPAHRERLQGIGGLQPGAAAEGAQLSQLVHEDTCTEARKQQ